LNRISLIVGMVLACGAQSLVLAAAADKKEAQAARDKPLLRCDHLTDKAQLDCLTKARERVLEARKKRESKGETRTEQKKPEPAPPKAQPEKRQ
jgi:hypothetical protein